MGLYRKSPGIYMKSPGQLKTVIQFPENPTFGTPSSLKPETKPGLPYRQGRPRRLHSANTKDPTLRPGVEMFPGNFHTWAEAQQPERVSLKYPSHHVDGEPTGHLESE